MKIYIDLIKIGLKEQSTYCSHLEAVWDVNTWYFDVKKYIQAVRYPQKETSILNKTI